MSLNGSNQLVSTDLEKKSPKKRTKNLLESSDQTEIRPLIICDFKWSNKCQVQSQWRLRYFGTTTSRFKLRCFTFVAHNITFKCQLQSNQMTGLNVTTDSNMKQKQNWQSSRPSSCFRFSISATVFRRFRKLYEQSDTILMELAP